MTPGGHQYLPSTDLELFEWRPASMPDPARLRCKSRFAIGKAKLPKFDRFGVFDWDDVISRVGRNMARVLESIRERGNSSERDALRNS